jgi:hypothetical protein
MRLYVQDRHTEKMTIFLRLADKRREHTHSPLQSQVVRLSRQQFSIWRSTGIELGGGPTTRVHSYTGRVREQGKNREAGVWRGSGVGLKLEGSDGVELCSLRWKHDDYRYKAE